MPYAGVMGMPIRAFWYVSGTVDRLQSEQRRGLLEIHMAAQSQESFQQVHAALTKAAPEPVKYKAEAHHMLAQQEEPEPGAFDILRSLA